MKGEYTVEIKQHKESRSLNANSYAWVLMERIAVATRQSKEEVYEEMLRRYGTNEKYTDDNGNEAVVMFSMRHDIPPKLAAKHYAEIGIGYVNGQEFNHYRSIKGSSEYDTHEMSVFIDGIVSECQEIGIETLTPTELERMKLEWK